MGLEVIVKRLLFIVACLGLGGTSWAGFTALNYVPIADILRHREALFSYSLTGYERNIDKRYYHNNGLTVGLLDRIEVGYDTDLANTTSLNAKLLVVDGYKGFSASVGVSNWADRTADPYVSLSYDLERCRLHGGLWSQGGVGTAYIGIDFGLGDSFTIMGEHITSGIGSTWVGGFYSVKQVPGLGVQLAVGIPNDRSQGLSHMLYISYGYRF